MLHLSKEQFDAWSYALQGKNLAILGCAGCGKSYVLQPIIRALEKKGKRVAHCAPTGMSALTIEGKTMHSRFCLPHRILGQNYKPTPEQLGRISFYDVFIFDEIGACRADVFAWAVQMIWMVNPRAQIIVCGDFLQCPPVLTNEDAAYFAREWKGISKEAHAFEAKEWEKAGFKYVFLEKNQRQKEEPTYARALEQLAHGNPAGAWYIMNHCSKTPLDAVYLCARKTDVNRINKRELKRLPGKKVVFYAEKVDENATLKPAKILELKVGARVMSLVKIKDTKVVNGTTGIVKEIDERAGRIRVCFDNGEEATVGRMDFKNPDYIEGGTGEEEHVVCCQFPIVLAYAITIHKAQSLTLEKANIIPSCFTFGQFYTAVSRVKSVEGIYLTNSFRVKYLKVDKNVLEFYKRVRGVGDENDNFIG